jgi:hypothetical protein
MAWKLVVMVLVVILTSSCGRFEEPSQGSAWSAGFWRMTADEDNGPLGEVMEFTADGGYIWHGRDCVAYPQIDAHVHNGDIYVTSTIPGKGPVAVIFHPNADHTQLTFTSPRTKNDATYQRISGNKCVVQN